MDAKDGQHPPGAGCDVQVALIGSRVHRVANGQDLVLLDLVQGGSYSVLAYQVVTIEVRVGVNLHDPLLGTAACEQEPILPQIAGSTKSGSAVARVSEPIVLEHGPGFFPVLAVTRGRSWPLPRAAPGLGSIAGPSRSSRDGLRPGYLQHGFDDAPDLKQRGVQPLGIWRCGDRQRAAQSKGPGRNQPARAWGSECVRYRQQCVATRQACGTGHTARCHSPRGSRGPAGCRRRGRGTRNSPRAPRSRG